MSLQKIGYNPRNKQWFASATPTNAKYATIDIGSGDNGVVTVTNDIVGEEGNEYSIVLENGDGNSVDLSAVLNDYVITVILATDESGDPDDTKNTATLVAAEIDAISGFSAEASGTGATVIVAATTEDFTGGVYATKATESVILKIGGVLYLTEGSVYRTDTEGWYSCTPSAI